MKIVPIQNTSINLYKNYSQNFTAKTSIIPKISKQQQCELGVFIHHIYEYKKGLRSLILTTEKQSNKEYIKYRLDKEKIPYEIQPVGDRLVNVFFGDENCINVVKTFKEPLSKLSDEQDFMLGIMLGYDKILQCQRYLKRLGNKLKSTKA